MRQEYEEQIENLNDEKRALILKYTAASAEVQNAEKRTYQRDEEINQLKAKVTSLELALERSEMASHGNSIESSYSPPPKSPTRTRPKASLPAPKTPPSSYSQRMRSSPSPTIDRAKRQKDKQEHMLRSHIATLRRTPTKVGSDGTDGNQENTSAFDVPPRVKRVSPRRDRQDQSYNYSYDSRQTMVNKRDEIEERRDDDLSATASSYSGSSRPYQSKYRSTSRSQASGQRISSDYY